MAWLIVTNVIICLLLLGWFVFFYNKSCEIQYDMQRLNASIEVIRRSVVLLKLETLKELPAEDDELITVTDKKSIWRSWVTGKE